MSRPSHDTPTRLAGDLPSPLTELLERSLEGRPPPRRQRVFVNRNLRMESIAFVGFDLDWTLAAYDRMPLEELTFALTIDRLVEAHDYPEVIRQAELHPDFFARGLMIDKQAGTVLKMNRHRYVGEAFLGRDRLDREKLARLYRHEPVRPSSGRFYHVDSLFELPEVNLFSELVQLRLDGAIDRPYEKISDEVRQAVDWVHAEGELKARILAEPERFLRRSPELAVALERLALGGRRLILLTNSDWHYADAICSYLFDGALPGLDSWRQLFDLAVVGARKPGFFRYQRPFVELDGEGEPVDELEAPDWGGIYRAGSLSGLMKLLDVPGEAVLYVGDHIYGDIVRSKMESTWRTALVVQELEEELDKRAELADESERLGHAKRRVARLGHEMDHLSDAMAILERAREEGLAVPDGSGAEIRRRFERTARQHRAARREMASLMEEIESAFNPLWGSLFKQYSSKTFFASQLEQFACVYTSRVENFALYGTNHYFRVLEDPMMHEAEE